MHISQKIINIVAMLVLVAFGIFSSIKTFLPGSPLAFEYINIAMFTLGGFILCNVAVIIIDNFILMRVPVHIFDAMKNGLETVISSCLTVITISSVDADFKTLPEDKIKEFLTMDENLNTVVEALPDGVDKLAFVRGYLFGAQVNLIGFAESLMKLLEEEGLKVIAEDCKCSECQTAKAATETNSEIKITPNCNGDCACCDQGITPTEDTDNEPYIFAPEPKEDDTNGKDDTKTD